jgi:hypothetical protein
LGRPADVGLGLNRRPGLAALPLVIAHDGRSPLALFRARSCTGWKPSPPRKLLKCVSKKPAESALTNSGACRPSTWRSYEWVPLSDRATWLGQPGERLN